MVKKVDCSFSVGNLYEDNNGFNKLPWCSSSLSHLSRLRGVNWRIITLERQKHSTGVTFSSAFRLVTGREPAGDPLNELAHEMLFITLKFV